MLLFHAHTDWWEQKKGKNDSHLGIFCVLSSHSCLSRSRQQREKADRAADKRSKKETYREPEDRSGDPRTNRDILRCQTPNLNSGWKVDCVYSMLRESGSEENERNRRLHHYNHDVHMCVLVEDFVSPTTAELHNGRSFEEVWDICLICR